MSRNTPPLRDPRLETLGDDGQWTFRMTSPDINYLTDRGMEWVRLNTCKGYRIV